MSNLLKEFEQSPIRNIIKNKDKEVIIYNAITEEQQTLLNNILDKSQTMQLANGKEQVNNFLPPDTIRSLLREFTNIELVHETNLDDYSDEDIVNLCKLYDFAPVFNEVTELYIEYGNIYYRETRLTIQLAQVQTERKIAELELMKLFSELGVDLTQVDIANMTQEDLQKIIEDNAKKKSVKKPQDHKKPRRTNSKKKVKEETNKLDIPQENIDALNNYNNNMNDIAVKYSNDIETIGDIIEDFNVIDEVINNG